MATISRTNMNTTTGHPATTNKVYVKQSLIDFAVIEATTGITIGATDTFEVMDVPKGTVVFAAGWEVLTVESGNATATLQLGDQGAGGLAADDNRYVASVVLTSLGYVDDSSLQIQANVPVFFEAAGKLTMLGATAAMTNAKIRVWAVMANVDDDDNIVTGTTDRHTYSSA